MVAKGIMYDSGGISLKPSDAVHATMKNDMSGAGGVLGGDDGSARPGLPPPWSPATSLCTDNMPSGTALKLGDVITIHGGTTVEVMNTDAEGRLVMADALVMAAAERPDAIVDIATLTGATMRALGTWIAGVIGNDEALIDQIRTAPTGPTSRTWPFPLEQRLPPPARLGRRRHQEHGRRRTPGRSPPPCSSRRSWTARPWAHIDIAGTAQADPPESWRTKGCTGFGARLLAELAPATSA